MNAYTKVSGIAIAVLIAVLVAFTQPRVVQADACAPFTASELCAQRAGWRADWPVPAVGNLSGRFPANCLRDLACPTPITTPITRRFRPMPAAIEVRIC